MSVERDHKVICACSMPPQLANLVPYGVINECGDFVKAPKQKAWLRMDEDKDWLRFWSEHQIYEVVYRVKK